MAVVVPDEGKLLMLEWVLINEDPLTSNFVVNLFKNDYSPTNLTTVGDFVLADFDGYLSIDIPRSAWSAPAIVGGKASSSAPSTPLHWDNEGVTPQTVYGYLVEDPDTGVVVWCKRFASPQVINPSGYLDLTLTFTDREDS